uniref:hypothetical protein n=1 Tax=uncultured Caulobacter sp. TaxID=158749 RepID=UPI0025EF10C6|nr:hypothetical protein [uncultured Caulobacter sp.]
MARQRRAKGVTAGEVRAETSEIWTSTAAGGAMALLAIGAAAYNHYDPQIHADALTWVIAAGFVLSAIWMGVAVRVRVVRLLPDRVEKRGVLGLSTITRAQVVGLRGDGDDGIKLCRARQGGEGLWIPRKVVRDPVWLAWLETLPDLDLEDAREAQARREGDERFGLTPGRRLETLERLARANQALTWCGVGLFVWLSVWPQPYDAAVLAGLASVPISLALVARWRGVATLAALDSGGLDLARLCGLASVGLLVRGVADLDMFDWAPMLAAGVAGGAVMAALLAILEPVDRRVMAVALGALIGGAWAWAGLAFANVMLDDSRPTLVRAVVVEAHGAAERNLSVKVRGLDPSSEVFGDLGIAKDRFDSARPGMVVCVAVHPGRLGWRWGYVADCKPTAP